MSCSTTYSQGLHSRDPPHRTIVRRHSHAQSYSGQPFYPQPFPTTSHHYYQPQPFQLPPTMAQMTPTEMEEFQNLSDRYHADLPGPLIGDKLTMDVLVTEYAQADPTFVVKTTGLATTHTAYRAIKGDGQCGWRATVFSYFEILLDSGDISLVEQEKVRFTTYAETMRMVGIDYDLIMDMFDYTWELFDRILQAVQMGNRNDAVILEVMNDEIKSNSIVYHFKMVTSAYMQLRADEYAPFLEMTVEEYRVARIDPTTQEIDQIGLQVLTDAVIRPAGFGLEVLYLDRSMGEEVTPHQFAEGYGVRSTIRLLYRPGHYDIIYKEYQPLQIYMQPHHNSPQYISDTYHNVNSNSDINAFLFGSSMSAPHGNQYTNGMPYNGNQHYMETPQYENYYPTQPTFSVPQSYPQPTHEVPSPMSLPSNLPQSRPQLTRQTSNSSRAVTVSPSPASASMPVNEPQIRFSSTMIDMHKHESVPLGLSSGSSASNSDAHFRNPNFQPNIYNPADDYCDAN